jgi:hypothetical protein
MLATNLHIQSMSLVKIPSNAIQHICSFLDPREIIVLQKTCSLLYQQLDWSSSENSEFALSVKQNHKIPAFISSKLCYHIKTENTDAVENMLSWPFDNLINTQNEQGVIPIMAACSCQSDTMLDLLLKRGAHLQLHNKSNIMHHLFANRQPASTLTETLTMVIETQSFDTMVQIINQQDESGNTPLYYLLRRFRFSDKKNSDSLNVEITVGIIKILNKFAIRNSDTYCYNQQILHDIFPSIPGLCKYTKEDYNAINCAFWRF